MPRTWLALSRCLLCSLLAVASAPAFAQKPDEYQVKAAFVANFSGFVEWPSTVFHSPSEPFSICVFGRNPFGGALESVVAGKSTGEHPLIVRTTADLLQLATCQIVFVSASERLRYRAVLDNLKATSALTVGDTVDFLSEGGMIALRVDGGRIRMQINPEAATERRLHISAHLLQLAGGH